MSVLSLMMSFDDYLERYCTTPLARGRSLEKCERLTGVFFLQLCVRKICAPLYFEDYVPSVSGINATRPQGGHTHLVLAVILFL